LIFQLNKFTRNPAVPEFVSVVSPILWEKGTIRRKIKTVSVSGGDFYIKLTDYKYADLWEGGTITESHYA